MVHLLIMVLMLVLLVMTSMSLRHLLSLSMFMVLMDHTLMNIPVVTAGGVATSQQGNVIVILHQYAYTGHGNTIHLLPQIEQYGNNVNDHSVHFPDGLQWITTLDGYVHPINIIDALPYVLLHPFSDEEWEMLPHVIWTSDADWDPSVLDLVLMMMTIGLMKSLTWRKTHEPISLTSLVTMSSIWVFMKLFSHQTWSLT
jgi:hypothetical protein